MTIEVIERNSYPEMSVSPQSRPLFWTFAYIFFLFTSYEGQIQSLFLAKAMLVVEISSKAIHAETCLLSQSVECVT